MKASATIPKIAKTRFTIVLRAIFYLNEYSSGNCAGTFKAIQKRKKFFELDNCYPQDMDTGFQA